MPRQGRSTFGREAICLCPPLGSQLGCRGIGMPGQAAWLAPAATDKNTWEWCRCQNQTRFCCFWVTARILIECFRKVQGWMAIWLTGCGASQLCSFWADPCGTFCRPSGSPEAYCFLSYIMKTFIVLCLLSAVLAFRSYHPHYLHSYSYPQPSTLHMYYGRVQDNIPVFQIRSG